MLVHKKLAPYHSQANGQAEITNETLGGVLTKIVSDKRSDWELKLHQLYGLTEWRKRFQLE